MQLNFAFKPTAVGEFDEEMLVEYDSGETCYARLTGAAAEVDVALERSLLTLDACYISLVSQSAIRLHNRSDIRVSFSWRQFESAAAEAQAKMVSLANLSLDGGLGASLARQKRRAIELDPLPFSHDVFAIEPSEGEIFPGCYCELTVVFKPETAGDINAVAFCEVNGRDARLPLRLQGKGLGPKATWLYDSLDVGDVFIHSTHRYEVVLENHGEIGTEYGVQARGPLPPPTGLFHSHPTASPPHLSDPHPFPTSDARVGLHLGRPRPLDVPIQPGGRAARAQAAGSDRGRVLLASARRVLRDVPVDAAGAAAAAAAAGEGARRRPELPLLGGRREGGGAPRGDRLWRRLARLPAVEGVLAPQHLGGAPMRFKLLAVT